MLDKNKTLFNIVGIEAFKSDGLKHAETKEKLVLPGAEEIQTEKTIQGLLQGVEGFEAEKLRRPVGLDAKWYFLGER